MKTFEQYMEEDREIVTVHGSYSQKRIHSMNWEEQVVARETWHTCESEYRALIEKPQAVKSYQEWLHETLPNRYLGHGISSDYSEQAWDFQESQWRHFVANKEQALKLKSEAFDILKKKNEELERQIEAYEQTFPQRPLKARIEELLTRNEELVKLIWEDQPEIKKILERLKDAEEVIAFYAESTVLSHDPGDYKVGELATDKRAREYFKKYGESK